MSLARFWSNFKLLHLSKPAGDRPLYRATRGRQISTVLEVNIGDAKRSERLIGWLREQGTSAPLRYAAIDVFEMGGSDHLTLKSCHSRLSKLGVKPFAVPVAGGLSTALARVAHTIGALDLLVLDCDPSELDSAAVRAILPRLVHDSSILIGRSAGGVGLAVIESRPADTDAVRRAA